MLIIIFFTVMDLLTFLCKLKSKKNNHKKIEILAKRKLTSNECYISGKVYAFIIEEVRRQNKSKEVSIKEIKSQLTNFKRKKLIDYG